MVNNPGVRNLGMKNTGVKNPGVKNPMMKNPGMKNMGVNNLGADFCFVMRLKNPGVSWYGGGYFTFHKYTCKLFLLPKL